MKEFVHVGVPVSEPMPGEVYVAGIKCHIAAPETNDWHIEYLRFDKDTPMPKELQTMGHVAYKVDNLAQILKETKVIVKPWMADEHTKIAFVMKNGFLFELMEVK